jgi:hypothetical protein
LHPGNSFGLRFLQIIYFSYSTYYDTTTNPPTTYWSHTGQRGWNDSTGLSTLLNELVGTKQAT